MSPVQRLNSTDGSGKTKPFFRVPSGENQRLKREFHNNVSHKIWKSILGGPKGTNQGGGRVDMGGQAGPVVWEGIRAIGLTVEYTKKELGDAFARLVLDVQMTNTPGARRNDKGQFQSWEQINRQLLRDLTALGEMCERVVKSDLAKMDQGNWGQRIQYGFSDGAAAPLDSKALTRLTDAPVPLLGGSQFVAEQFAALLFKYPALKRGLTPYFTDPIRRFSAKLMLGAVRRGWLNGMTSSMKRVGGGAKKDGEYDSILQMIETAFNEGVIRSYQKTIDRAAKKAEEDAHHRQLHLEHGTTDEFLAALEASVSPNFFHRFKAKLKLLWLRAKNRAKEGPSRGILPGRRPTSANELLEAIGGQEPGVPEGSSPYDRKERRARESDTNVPVVGTIPEHLRKGTLESMEDYLTRLQNDPFFM